jgi:hypothetical protein
MEKEVKIKHWHIGHTVKGIALRISEMNGNLFFLLLFGYHVLVIFQGLDFNDEGFHAAFYQQIFSDPESVKFGFWMWLTGIIGGTFMKLFPFLGLWGIRFAGAVITTATIIISYNLLKKHLHTGYLRISMVLLSLFINGDAKTLYYNNLSAFFYFLVAYFLYRGLKESNKTMMFFAGFFVCLNIFTRIPNLLGVGMAVLIFYYGYITHSRFKDQLLKLGVFIAGIVFSALVVFSAMKYLGHLPYFLESVKMIFSSSQEAKQADGIGGAYGIFRLLTRNLGEYGRALRAVFLVVVLIVFIGMVNYAARRSVKTGKWAVPVFGSLVIAALVLLIARGWLDDYRLLLLFTGIGLTAGLQLFNKSKTPGFKLLVSIGLLILLIHPFGSSEGIHTVGIYSLWICFPVAIDAVSAVQWLNFNFRMDTTGSLFSVKAGLSPGQLRAIRIISICLIGLACMYNVLLYPYLCDQHSRVDMTHPVNNTHMRGIFTSAGRATALNELLLASGQYVKPNDYVLAYDCMPMYHYMTETKSYVRNPCIWFYSNNLFLTELQYAESHKKNLPVVVRQNIKTTGDGSSLPETAPAELYSQLKRNQGKNTYLNDFIKRHNYREVWSNQAFSIFIPPGK